MSVRYWIYWQWDNVYWYVVLIFKASFQIKVFSHVLTTPKVLGVVPPQLTPQVAVP